MGQNRNATKATNTNAASANKANEVTCNIEQLRWYQGEKRVDIQVMLDKRIKGYEQNKTTMAWQEVERYYFNLPLQAFIQMLCDSLLDTDLDNKDVNRIKRQLKSGALSADIIGEFSCTEVTLRQEKVVAGSPAKEWDGRPKLNEDGSPQTLRRDEWFTSIVSYEWIEDTIEMLLSRSQRRRENC